MKKSICSLLFFWNQSLSLKWDELRPWILSTLFLVKGQDKWVVLIGIRYIDEIVSRKKHLRLCFAWNQSLSLKWMNFDSGLNIVSFHKGPRQMGWFSLKRDEHHPWIESSLFSQGAKTNG